MNIRIRYILGLTLSLGLFLACQEQDGLTPAQRSDLGVREYCKERCRYLKSDGFEYAFTAYGGCTCIFGLKELQK